MQAAAGALSPAFKEQQEFLNRVYGLLLPVMNFIKRTEGAANEYACSYFYARKDHAGIELDFAYIEVPNGSNSKEFNQLIRHAEKYDHGLDKYTENISEAVKIKINGSGLIFMNFFGSAIHDTDINFNSHGQSPEQVVLSILCEFANNGASTLTDGSMAFLKKIKAQNAPTTKGASLEP